MTKRFRILVVDDDLEDQMIMQAYFDEVGLGGQVAYCENGHDALDLLEEIREDSSLPGLIILDLNMPIMNGTKTLVHLKQNVRLKNIPVVIFSTSENETEKRKCLSLGAVDYMVKPLTLEDGLATVERFSSFIIN